MSDLYDNNKSIVAQRLTQDFRDFKKDYEPKGNDFSSFFQSPDLKSLKYNEPPEYKLMPQHLHRNIRYKSWMPDCLQPNQKHKKLTDKEIMELLYRMQITVTPPKMPDDTRKCMFCQGKSQIQYFVKFFVNSYLIGEILQMVKCVHIIP